MKPSADYLAECGRRILAVARGTPRRRDQLDALAAECGIVIGSLCQTADEARELTEHLVRHPPPRWDFPAFQQRAAKFRQAPNQQSIEQAQAAEEREYQARHVEARKIFANLPPISQTKQLECKRAVLAGQLADDPEAWVNPPTGANFRIRTLFHMAAAHREALLEELVIIDIMATNHLVASPEAPSPARGKLTAAGQVLKRRRQRKP
jgi:hypothetical protein